MGGNGAARCSQHWCQKRKFLMGKRGVEKPPFQLPEFIAATGIERIRASVMEKENAKKLKGKQKERMQPKMGKIDIDYQVRRRGARVAQSPTRPSVPAAALVAAPGPVRHVGRCRSPPAARPTQSVAPWHRAGRACGTRRLRGGPRRPSMARVLILLRFYNDRGVLPVFDGASRRAG
eukprot:5346384-Prymnesium_polylepis.2